MPGARRPLAIAAGIAFLLLVVALTGPIAPMGIATALCGVLTLACLAMRAAPAAGATATWPRTPVDRAAIGWVLALIVASAFAIDPAGSFPRVAKGLMPALVGLAAYHAADRKQGQRGLVVYLVAVAVVSSIGLAAWVAAGAGYTWRARGLAHHYMTFGGQLLLEFPVALAIALTAREPRWRWGASAVALVTAIALATTFTRSAWLGAFAASVVVLAGAWPLGLALLVAGAAGAWVFAGGEWRDRLHGMFDPSHGYNGERLLMWQAGGRMFQSDPWTGVGLQDMHAVYPLFKSPQATEEIGHLHSTFVQIAASMGLIGLAAFAWLYASLLRAAYGLLGPLRGLAARLRAGGPGAGLRLGVTAALVGFLVAGVFEWNFGDEELLYHLYTLVGLAWASRAWQRSGAEEAVAGRTA
jgi:O-antigen ligase